MSAKKKDNIEKGIIAVPLYNIRIMTDEEWNRLAYQNYLKRKAAES